jgi:5-methylcytosine-specific restriction protein A
MTSNKWRGSNRASRLPSNWASLRRLALKRDDFKCRLCGGTEDLEVDHIERGDNHALENLRTLCRTCHKGKSSKEGNQAKAAMRAARFRKKPAHPGRRQSGGPTSGQETGRSKRPL